MPICKPLGYDRLAPCIRKKVEGYGCIGDIGGGEKNPMECFTGYSSMKIED